MSCRHWAAGAYCGAGNTREYIVGRRCPAHTPAALAGRPDITADPELSMSGLQARSGMVVGFSRADTSAIDEKAVRSGKRAAGRGNYFRTRRALAEDASKGEHASP
jgi:hypothetical protein